MRSYSLLTGTENTVFLELKKKVGGIVTKRRAVLTSSQAAGFLETSIIPDTDNYKDRQVLAEIGEFLGRYPASPKVFISYERTAFFAKDNPELRVSFDRDILSRRQEVNLTSGDYGSELLSDDRILMEIKSEGNIPLWLCHLLSERKIHKAAFSKYGTEYKKYVQSISDMLSKSLVKKPA